ncbi:hypothetical protein NicSoilB4_12900 [Arthrobacter sp. NicSoilB4]|uniref:hypothetical protein n=1 Tax=Arthrobacter sp. NicSoilB4 TaxID=2830997 RepID=UPI001CC3F0E7|nr:hypothetical protein [Arthrobacter sp. NicSoilB4]BCW66527.1 hypothetical protein NicSoilB4_12900 [Arthrobacter sp. NicSoilB4]
MTEPNHNTEPDPDRGEARVTWPATPATLAEAGGAAGDAAPRDSAVDALLDRLDGLQGLPVEQHGEVYAGLHDDLLAALNEPVSTTSPGDAANEQA